APMPCGIKLQAILVSGSSAQGPPSEPIGTRDIDSTPPATTRSSQPERTFWAAILTASRPEAQTLLIWTPATSLSQPAAIAAVLAISAPWSPIGVTQPKTISSTLDVSRQCRSLSSLSRVVSKLIGLT